MSGTEATLYEIRNGAADHAEQARQSQCSVGYFGHRAVRPPYGVERQR